MRRLRLQMVPAEKNILARINFEPHFHCLTRRHQPGTGIIQHSLGEKYSAPYLLLKIGRTHSGRKLYEHCLVNLRPVIFEYDMPQSDGNRVGSFESSIRGDDSKHRLLRLTPNSAIAAAAHQSSDY